MTFLPSNPLEVLKAAPGKLGLKIENLLKAFDKLATLLLPFFEEEKEEPLQPQEPHTQLASLKGAVAPRLELTALKNRVEKPPEPLPTKAKPDFRYLGEGLTLDVANFTTPSEFIAALKAYATSLDENGQLKRTPYVWGAEGDSKGGVDCSGLIMAALTDQLGLARGDATALRMYESLIREPKKGTEKAPEARVGDLIFWVPRQARADGRTVSHVGMITEIFGDGRVRVIQSSGGRGYSEDNIFDLRKGTSSSELHFGTPKFYRS